MIKYNFFKKTAFPRMTTAMIMCAVWLGFSSNHANAGCNAKSGTQYDIIATISPRPGFWPWSSLTVMTGHTKEFRVTVSSTVPGLIPQVGSYIWMVDDVAVPGGARETFTYTGGELGNHKISVEIIGADQSTDEPCHATDSVSISVIPCDFKLQYKVAPMSGYVDFGSIKLLKNTALDVKAILEPAENWPASKPVWSGTFGVTGVGVDTVTHTYSGAASTSDSDFKTVIATCTAVKTGQVLVCDTVLGAHSNVGPGAGVTDGHAWITVWDYSATPATGQSYGLWPDGHPDYLPGGRFYVPPGGNNGPGWDIRTGREELNSAYQRFYVLTPSQKAILLACISANVTYNDTFYTYNCSSWASDTVGAVTGDDVDADDEWAIGMETPREFGESIQELEASDPTSNTLPAGNGDAIGSSSW